MTLKDDDKENYEERAAIMQYCGGLSRSYAERLAMQCVRQQSSDNAPPAARSALNEIMDILSD